MKKSLWTPGWTNGEVYFGGAGMLMAFTKSHTLFSKYLPQNLGFD